MPKNPPRNAAKAAAYLVFGSEQQRQEIARQLGQEPGSGGGVDQLDVLAAQRAIEIAQRRKAPLQDRLREHQRIAAQKVVEREASAGEPKAASVKKPTMVEWLRSQSPEIREQMAQ